MKEPAFATRLFGHPLVASPLMLGGFGVLFGCYQAGGEGLVPGILTLVALGGVGKAAERMNAYRQWRRAWNAMDEPRSGQPAGWWKKPLGAVLAALMLVYMLSQAARPEYQLALGWMVLFSIGASIFLLWRRWKGGGTTPRRHAASIEPVTICARPLLDTPDLAAAYRALPGYCRQVMR